MMNVLQSQESIDDTVGRNEDSILSALKIFVDMLDNLAQLSDIIYVPNSSFPLDIYKTFRKLYQNAESISNILENYQSQNQEFLQLKDQLVAEQISRMEQIINQQEKGTDNDYKFPNRGAKRYQNTRKDDESSNLSNLHRQIATLNNVLERNNLQFQEEIKKYNNHLYELKETIQRYELQLERIQELQVVIEELENKIIMLRQQKERDSLMIENMARKIRYFQKEIGGRDAFLSPRTSNSQSRHILSPHGLKPIHTTIGRAQSPSYRKYQ